MLESKPQDELNQLAEAIHAGRVFTDRHCREDRDIMFAFMVLAFMDGEQRKQLATDGVGMVYEYLEKASPRSCNGMPTFFSMQLLNSEDTEYVWNRVAKIRDALAAI